MSADLFEGHRQLIALTEELLALVRRVPAVRLEVIAELRAHLGRHAVAHLRLEDEQIMKPLLASGRADEIPDACLIIAEIRIGNRYYSDYSDHWTMQAVERDRVRYAEALAAMVDHLHDSTERKERLLYRPVLKLLGSPAYRVH